MYEIEVKVRAEPGRVRERLDSLGAEPIGTVEQADTYFDHPARSFAATDEALRLRRERPLDESTDSAAWNTRLTYKGPLVEAASKTREEIETAIGDGTAVEGILDALGFDPVATVRKQRERYRLREYTVSVDRVDRVGSFVEVETIGSEADIDRLRTGAYDLLRELGCDPEEHLRTSYLELLLDR